MYEKPRLYLGFNRKIHTHIFKIQIFPKCLGLYIIYFYIHLEAAVFREYVPVTRTVYVLLVYIWF